MQISFIIPTLNEATVLAQTLASLRQSTTALNSEIILIDGGSQDQTIAIAAPLTDRIIQTKAGRALQMNAGAQIAQGEWLMFLHADTLLPQNIESIWRDKIMPAKQAWGRFNVRLSGSHPHLQLVAHLMNLRSKMTGIATGDQAIFVRRALFQTIGGYAQIPLMEDIELSKRLKRLSRPLCIDAPLVTSSRRWEQRGIWRTILLMWKLRFLYFLGVSPSRLVKQYDNSTKYQGNLP